MPVWRCCIGCLNGSWDGNYGGVKTADGSTPPLEEVTREAVLEEVETNVLRRQNTVDQYIVKQMILELFEEAVDRLGKRV